MECREIVDSVKADNRHETETLVGFFYGMEGGGGFRSGPLQTGYGFFLWKIHRIRILDFPSFFLALEPCFLLDALYWILKN